MSNLNGYAIRGYNYIKGKFPTRILAQRIFKCVFNVTVALILCLNPNTVRVLGNEPAMLPLIAVIAHPGRRLGTMIECVCLCSSGILLGNAYALLGRFLAQKALGTQWNQLSDSTLFKEDYNGYRAALCILAVFEIIMLFFHGWMRSVSHKFFPFVFQLFLVVHFAFTDSIKTDALTTFKTFSIPFFLGIGLSLASNLVLFPEFGSSYLGRSMILTLNELQNALDTTVQFFISFDEESKDFYNSKPITLKQLIKKKSDLRTKLNSTKAVLHECIYEISYSYNSPDQLKQIIDILSSQLSFTNALINACQLEFKSLLSNDDKTNLKNNLLLQVLKRTKIPINNLQKMISQNLLIIKYAIGYSYDVKLSKISKSPNSELDDVNLENVDFELQLNELAKAMAQFDIMFREELKTLGSEYDNYFGPNDDMFLISSFLINLRETANAICNVLKEANKIYSFRKERERKGIFGRKFWVLFLSSFDKLKIYLGGFKSSPLNGTETASLNGSYIRPRTFIEDEFDKISSKSHIKKDLDGKKICTNNKIKKSQIIDNFLVSCSDFYKKYQPHFRFGFQITVGLMLSSFPMFVPESRQWFTEYRGTWIAFVCILVLEPEVGSTFFVFFLRGVGVILGSAWGYVSYVAAINQTNVPLEVFVTVIGAIPGFYVFIGTPYVKAAIIGIISIYIVLLSTVIPSEIGGSIAVNFGKRCLAMLYGGLVALVCQLIFFPIKARDELIKEVAFSTGAISKLILLYASGLDGEDIKSSISEERYDFFTKLLAYSRSSLLRADAYRNTAKKEPRLKGSFDDISSIFYEIIFILREILDRIDNIVQLRRVYGSAIIEEFNSDVHPYRRQLSASLSNSFKTVQLAMLTKAPLPQYIPSVKIAHQRLFEKVREVVEAKYHRHLDSLSESEDSDTELFVNFKKSKGDRQQDELLNAKFLSWNATSAATEEVIDYIEELLELTKLLVGVNEFKYGFLSRTLYSDYAAKATRGYKDVLVTHDVTDDHLSLIINNEDSDLEEYNAELDPVGLTVTRSADSSLSNGFRRRVYSISSWINGGDLTSTKSLGDYPSEFDEFDEEEEEEEENNKIPLSLMRVMSKRKGEDQNDKKETV